MYVGLVGLCIDLGNKLSDLTQCSCISSCISSCIRSCIRSYFEHSSREAIEKFGADDYVYTLPITWAYLGCSFTGSTPSIECFTVIKA